MTETMRVECVFLRCAKFGSAGVPARRKLRVFEQECSGKVCAKAVPRATHPYTLSLTLRRWRNRLGVETKCI